MSILNITNNRSHKEDGATRGVKFKTPNPNPNPNNICSN